MIIKIPYQGWVKRLSIAVLLLGTFIVTPGCKKIVYNDALPVVETYSVKMLGADSVIISGHLLSTGADLIQYEGFCYDTKPNPDILKNQTFKVQSDTFFYRHIAVYQDSDYYYRCFAANGYGYTLSKTYHFTIPAGHPETAPCTTGDNSIVNQGIAYKTAGVTKSGPGYAIFGAVWGVKIDCRPQGGPLVSLSFYKKPVNGIYTTQTSNTGPSSVYAIINNYPVSNGASIYVAENPDGTVTITYCGLVYNGIGNNMANITTE